MAHLQRALFLSKRLNTTFRHVYLRCIYRRQPFHKQDGIVLPTCGKFNFYLFNTPAVKNLEQLNKHFCTLAKNEDSENSEIEEGKYLSPTKTLDDINLSDDNLIQTYKDLMAIHLYYKFRRNSDFEKKFAEFTASEEFKNFCDSLEKRLPTLSANELKLLLKIDVFGVSVSSALMQKIYHLVIEKINEYSPLEIISIYLIMQSLSHGKTPTGKVVRLVCERYFHSKLVRNISLEKDYNKMAHYTRALRLPLSVKRRLLEIITNELNNIHPELTLKALSQVFGAFASEGVRNLFKAELYDVLKARAKTEEVNYGVIRNTMMGLVNLIDNEITYDEEFLNFLAEKALTRGIGVTNLTLLVNAFIRIGHLPWSLIRHIEGMLAKDSFVLDAPKLAHSVARLLANAYYHPMGYTGDDANHITCLKKLDSIDVNNKPNLAMYVTWCLYITVLGSPKSAEKINELFTYLTETYRDSKEIKELIEPRSVEAILTLNAFAKKNFPGKVRKLPKEWLEMFYEVLQNDFIDLMHGEIRKLIDPNSAVEYCTTSDHRLIDFAVHVDKNKKPMEIQIDFNKPTSDGLLRLEDINVTPNSELILLQIHRGEFPFRFRNSSDLPGCIRLYLDSFEPFQCKVVLFSKGEYRRLYIKKRNSYLTEKFKEFMQ